MHKICYLSLIFIKKPSHKEKTRLSKVAFIVTRLLQPNLRLYSIIQGCMCSLQPCTRLYVKFTTSCKVVCKVLQPRTRLHVHFTTFYSKQQIIDQILSLALIHSVNCPDIWVVYQKIEWLLLFMKLNSLSSTDYWHQYQLSSSHCNSMYQLLSSSPVHKHYSYYSLSE